MAINPLQPGPILFTRQRHEAKKMGLHWDYRMVVGDKAYSWATKKEMPEPGKSIVLFEQPVHDSHYALSQRVEIPDGQYGAGMTTLDYVRKGQVEEGHPDGTLVIRAKTDDGEQRFLLKKLDDSKYGRSAWLFRNLTGIEKKSNMTNKYLEKIAAFAMPSEHHKAVFDRRVNTDPNIEALRKDVDLAKARDVIGQGKAEAQTKESPRAFFRGPPESGNARVDNRLRRIRRVSLGRLDQKFQAEDNLRDAKEKIWHETGGASDRRAERLGHAWDLRWKARDAARLKTGLKVGAGVALGAGALVLAANKLRKKD